jgi:hydroxymethylbilane synthase
MLPAAGQGALGIEMRRDDPRRTAVTRALHHQLSAVAVTAERKVLSGLGGGCRVPVAILCEAAGKNRLRLRAAFSREEDGRLLRAEATGSAKNPDRLVEQILAQLTR